MNTPLDNFHSKYIFNIVFNHIQLKNILELVRHSKKYQNKLLVDKNTYKNFFPIILEIIPTSILGRKNTFIHYNYDELVITLIKNDGNQEKIKRNYILSEDHAEKIIIKFLNKKITLRNLFNNCSCIKEITFVKFVKDDISDMSYMFMNCENMENINEMKPAMEGKEIKENFTGIDNKYLKTIMT